MATKPGTKPLTPWQRFLNLISGLTSPAIYGAAVTATLALYFAAVRHGDITAWPIMVKFVSMQFTPFFMLGYHITRRVLPDKTIRSTTNLLLPAVEGLLAVLAISALMALGFELDDPYKNMWLYAAELLSSILAARIVVRNVFRH